ncbi:MAG: hypothetical protein RIT20_1805, partial [Pseudomonadota bacterium]
MAQKIWTPKHADALRQALTASGADVAALTASLLLGKSHMANLLGASNNAFYNEPIRYAAGVKALKALGYSDSQINGLSAPELVTESAPHQATIEAPLSPPPSAPTTASQITLPTAPPTTPPTNQPSTPATAQTSSQASAQEAAGLEAQSPVSPQPRPAYHWHAMAVLVLGGLGYAAYQSMLPAKIVGAPATNLAEQSPIATASAPASEPAPVAVTATNPAAQNLSDKPAEPADKGSQPAPVSAQTAAAAPDESNVICDFSQPTTAQEAVKSVPNAPKGYVHFAATENDTLLCVKDRNGVISKVRLQAKNSRSIYGDEPLTVNFSKVHKPTVYYQRNKIYLREDT